MAPSRLSLEGLSESAGLYLFNHVFLPPRLPQEDDWTAGHEGILIDKVLDALGNFGHHIPTQYVSIVATITSMVTRLRDVRGVYGEVYELNVEILDSFGNKFNRRQKRAKRERQRCGNLTSDNHMPSWGHVAVPKPVSGTLTNTDLRFKISQIEGAPDVVGPIIRLLLAVEALHQQVRGSKELARIVSLDHADLIGFRTRFVEGDSRVIRAMREGGFLPIHILKQNAAILLTRNDHNRHVKSLQLSPRNRAVMATVSHLRRLFPTLTLSLDLETFKDPDFQSSLAHTLAQMGHESVSGTKAKVLKADEDHGEDRDTTDPKMVTEFMMAFLRPRCANA